MIGTVEISHLHTNKEPLQHNKSEDDGLICGTDM